MRQVLERHQPMAIGIERITREIRAFDIYLAVSRFAVFADQLADRRSRDRPRLRERDAVRPQSLERIDPVGCGASRRSSIAVTSGACPHRTRRLRRAHRPRRHGCPRTVGANTPLETDAARRATTLHDNDVNTSARLPMCEPRSKHNSPADSIDPYSVFIARNRPGTYWYMHFDLKSASRYCHRVSGRVLSFRGESRA